jgi:allantoin racemase
MNRVLVLVPFAMDEEGIENRRKQLAEAGTTPAVEFDFRGVKGGPAWFDSYHDFLLGDMAVFEAGLSAEEEGYAAVVVDTVSDSGVQALRSVLDIPVIGPARVMYLTALMLGSTFSILTQWDPWIASYKRSLQEHGLAHRCASVRSIDVPPDVRNLLQGKESVLPKLRDAGMRCVEEDGADVICMGSTTMHEAVEYLQRELPVPVINPGPLSYRMAEAMLALGLTHSRVAYGRPHTPKPEMAHAMMDAVVGGEGGSAR